MIQKFADWLVYGILGLNASTALGEAVSFFFYDTIKILILLFFISVVMGIVNAYFPIERLRSYLTSRKLYGLQYFLQLCSVPSLRSVLVHPYLYL